ncbi:hypothetical protein CB0940_10676 [Cercospora beticola]|uniref:Uncharacterized protein n=1 Tax=Cercospora beticola TaxID=122368 RepID=A0A2G5HU49_CERBT|nr:hypothetical protein CB0940_10676 [Cercospora beticola]PIA95742.1 hypothetical protein CB0940_10676 [Cercospora beticola]WPB07403.1 hypothetical protein RHO25_012064 [Cercospora beticola]CAK1367386.1 unnamed protein product [Cercospora beticola]
MSTMYLTPIPLTSWPTNTATANTTMSFPHPTPQIPTSTMPPPELQVSSAGTSSGSQPSVDWYFVAACMLLVYCAVSAILLYCLCGAGILDCRLNLDPSPHIRRNRLRRRMAQRASQPQPREAMRYWTDDVERAQLTRERHISRPAEAMPTIQQNESTTSVVTMLGHGDEPDVQELQRTLAANGLHLTERQVRSQRRALERIIRHHSLSAPNVDLNSMAGIRALSPIGFRLPVRRDISGDEISVEYARELERHREYRYARIRAYELQQNMTPEQRRRLQQTAQIEINMRNIGLI